MASAAAYWLAITHVVSQDVAEVISMFALCKAARFLPGLHVLITVFKTEAPIVNFTEGPRWDATSQRCFITETEPRALSRCEFSPDGNHFPYGKNKAWKDGKPILMRSAARNPLRRIPGTDNGKKARYEHAKGVIKQFLIHHDGCATADMCSRSDQHSL